MRGGAGSAGSARPARERSPIVSVREASFAYDPDHPVLKSLSFDVAPGDFVGVVGPNGSGKSTLLDLIDGVLAPVAGAVLVNGRPTRQYRRRDIAREVALVPQHFVLEFDLTVREVVEMGAYCRGADARRQSAAECGARQARHRRACRAPLPRAVGRRAADGRARPGARPERRRAAPGRAGVEPRRLPPARPVRAAQAAQRRRAHGDLRPARPEPGAHLLRPKLLVLSEGGVAAWGPAEEALSPAVLEAVYGVRAHGPPSRPGAPS